VAEHDSEPAVALDRRSLIWYVARLIGAAAVVIVVIVSVPGLGGLRARLSHAGGGWTLVSSALEVGSVMCFVLAFHSALAGRVRWRNAAPLALVAQGVNVLVPAGGTGGLAATGVMMTRAGLPAAFTASRMVALFLITAVATNVLLIIVAGVGVGAGLLPGHASIAASLLPAVLAAALIAVMAYVPRLLPSVDAERAVGWRAFVRRSLGYVGDGIGATLPMLRARDPQLIVGALGFVLFDLAALVAAFHAVGSSGLPVGTMMLAYTLGQAGSIVSLPGTTEGGLVGVFVLYGAPLVLATSAALVYRAVQSLVPLALGLVGVGALRQFFRDPALPVGVPSESDSI
jgi:uncharacterized membrane protein YbhN (UPF0104 family)